MWYLWFFKNIPGYLGCFLRKIFLPSRLGKKTYIWDNVHIDTPRNLIVGNNTSINRGSVINCASSVKIGNNVLIGPKVTIYSQNHNFNNPNLLINEQGYETKPVTIYDDVWIASNAVILPGVTIAKGTVVASGAVVTKNTEEFSVVAGVPAQKIGTRNG